MSVVACFLLVELRTNQHTHVVIEGSIVELKDTIKQLMKAAQVMGLDMQKTKYIKITKSQLIIKL